MVRSLLLLSVVWSSACGRTDLVRYSLDGVDLVSPESLEDAGARCVDGRLPLEPAHPVVMLVVDRSTSMNGAFQGSTRSKWEALDSALHQQLPAWNEQLMLGLSFFPGVSTSSCGVSTSADVAPALGSVDAVLARIDAASPGGSTPTAVAIEAAGATLLGMRSASTARAVVLATDGAPDCNAALDARTCTCVGGGGGGGCSAARCLDDVRTIERITSLRTAGIPTWVIGLKSSSDSVFVDALNRMAVAGGQPRQGADQFFSAASQAELEAAFQDVRSQVGACHYLSTSVPDPGGVIELYVDGQFVAYDETEQDGWHWADADNGELVLSGATCARALGLPLSALEVIVACASP